MSLWMGENTHVISSGKTKIISEFEQYPTCVKVTSKDDLTYQDGKKHFVMPGKAELATTTTVNVFTYLKRKGIESAYQKKINDESFLAWNCKMVQLEVVGRWQIAPESSVLKRNPDWIANQELTELLVEFYLKTKDQIWEGRGLPCDDPYLEQKAQEPIAFGVYHPKKAVCPENELFELRLLELGLTYHHLEHIKRETVRIGIVLRDAFSRLGCIFADFKIEFGFHPNGVLILADVIDNDSWRLYQDGVDISKQALRNQVPLETVKGYYERVALLTERFKDL